MPALMLLNRLPPPEIDTFFDIHFTHVMNNVVTFADSDPSPIPAVDRAIAYAEERVGQQGDYLAVHYRGKSLPLTFIGTTSDAESFSKHYTLFLNWRSAPHAERINPRLPVVSVRERFINGAADVMEDAGAEEDMPISRPEVIYNYLTQGDLRKTRGFTPPPPSPAVS